MATFEFYADQKVTMWERVTFSIEAETRNEAMQIAKQSVKTGNYPSDVWYDTLYDTTEPLSIKNNNGRATLELYTEDKDMIWTNTNEGYNV